MSKEIDEAVDSVFLTDVVQGLKADKKRLSSKEMWLVCATGLPGSSFNMEDILFAILEVL